ncbi:Cyclin-related, putative isoform 1 [Melia azedarach]|uniref:Cyclin-related, putative isoform 1 n=1 Tax=Melia azedarach TaxID=155640 RepID=A0ACC1XJ92_MELAZ|nr:Cyclin-related, putative isoform 1 [Melia azedarach]
MDAYQQSHRYMRPPPPPPSSAADQYHHHNPYFQQQQQPRPPVPPQGHQWFSNQFQYQPSSCHSPSPPPPPPPPSQWAPPPASSAYPPPPPPPYPAHHHHHNNHYPLPPRPQVPPPPPPPPPPQVAQSYPQSNQEWGNPNWAHHHQSWDYAAHNSVQDWAARAKEWANARVAMENQHTQSQFTSVGRSEEQIQFSDQYPQSADFHYVDTQQPPFPASSYQQFPAPAAPAPQPPVAYQQENASISSGLPSYGPDVRLPYSGRDGASAGEANVGFPHQESSHTSPSVHQQEVPSSYSSVTGKKETANQKEHLYRSLPVPISSGQEGQAFAYGNQAANPPNDLSDQPLDFAPRFNQEHDLHLQSSYAAHTESAGPVRGIDPAPALPSVNSWTPPVAPSVAYPPIPPVLPAGPQHDPSIAMASAPGPAAPQFGRFPGQSFQPTMPSASAFGIGAGAALHPTTAFSGDAYGVSGVSERPKKAPVPNWLKEEIIKNKAAITRSSLENPKEETQSIEEEGVHKLSGKSDQADSKSIDSSRSTEEEDDDEDYVEAARTAAINQEIKRILTEVLLKVTDELFDEIATKVLNEDDLSIDGNDNTVSRKVSPPPPAIPAPKASAKVLVAVKAKESEKEGGSERTSSSSPGDVLGLANYASDDDDGDDEIQSSGVPNSRNTVVQQSTMHDAAENGSHVKPEEGNGAQTNSQSDLNKTSTSISKNNNSIAINKLSENRVDKNAYSSDAISVDGGDNECNVDGRKLLDSNSVSKSNETLREKAGMKISTNDNSQSSEMGMKPVKSDRHESKRSSSGKDSVKEVEIGSGADNKGDRNHRRHDERHSRKEKADDRNGSRDRTRDEVAKPEGKAKESKSRKRSTDNVKDGRDAERHHRASTKEGIDRKRERSKEEDTPRHKLANESVRHKRRRSSSISNRGRNSKDDSVSHANDSSDESSDDSKRKQHSRKHNSSPSPVRSKTRGRRSRSRSRSPGRRQR